MQINALQNEISDETMVSNNLTTLTHIAEAGSYQASVQAQSLLNNVNGFTYSPSIILPTPGQLQLKTLPTNGVAAKPEVAMLDAQPNPARQTTTFRYHLPDGAETGRINITDLDGRVIASFEVSNEAGGLVWDVKGLREGIYLYSLVTDKKTLMAKRLVIVR